MAEFRLETERLFLREWRDADVPILHRMGNDPRVMEFLGPQQTLDEAMEAVARQQDTQRNLGYCFWVIERRCDASLIGFCGLKPGPEATPLEGKTEIGWRLAHDHWGQGYAREAAHTSLDWGFANLPDNAIWAITVPANIRSWGLMERLGMIRQIELDFEHPGVPDGSPLKPHITYRIGR